MDLKVSFCATGIMLVPCLRYVVTVDSGQMKGEGVFSAGSK